MLKKIFSKEEQGIEIKAPLSGFVIALEKVPDPVFSQKMMGDGIAIDPLNGVVISPISGQILTCFPHALGIKTEEGLEVLIHIGIETVKFKGEGSKKLVNPGDKVNEGDKLIEFDLNYYRKNAPSTISPIVITNMQKVKKIIKTNLKEVKKGEDVILKVILK